MELPVAACADRTREAIQHLGIALLRTNRMPGRKGTSSLCVCVDSQREDLFECEALVEALVEMGSQDIFPMVESTN